MIKNLRFLGFLGVINHVRQFYDERIGVSCATAIGWCVLAAGVAQLPAIFVSLAAAYLLGKTGLFLLLLTVPSGLLLIAGGIGLILRKFFGYHCVYVATFFGGIGGFKIPYLPLKGIVNIGPATEDLFLALNLVLVALLVWEHWRRVGVFQPAAQKVQRTAMLTLLALGISSVSFGRAMIHREKGEKDLTSSLPAVGASFTEFKTSGKLSYVSVETKLPRGVTLVFSGTATEPEMRALADKHHLTKMDQPEAHKKFLPQVKAWKLDPAEFPVKFSSEDLYYVGRLREAPKVSLQVVYRKSDGRFTAQVLGVLPK